MPRAVSLHLSVLTQWGATLVIKLNKKKGGREAPTKKEGGSRHANILFSTKFNVTTLLIPYASYTVANGEDMNENVQCSSVLREIWALASIRVTLSRFRIE